MKSIRLASLVVLPIALLIVSSGWTSAEEGVSKRFHALRATLPGTSTWAVLDRDGANRTVEPYLSSLGGGEAGTGLAESPEFALDTDAIALSICGHDGTPPGGLEKNYLALVDAAGGKELAKCVAPGSDPMVERTLDVKAFRGRRVRIRVSDGVAAGAFAWFGVGRLDAGPGMRVDFKQGLPQDWRVVSVPRPGETPVLLRGGVPFLDHRRTLVPASGAVSVSCGEKVKRLYFLGCTAAGGRPLERRGEIRLRYAGGATETLPLIVGFTLDGEYKLKSPSAALGLHASADPYLYYLVVTPREAVLEGIELERDPKSSGMPLISGITVETESSAEVFQSLPDDRPGEDEEAWIRAKALSLGDLKLEEVLATIRRDHKL